MVGPLCLFWEILWVSAFGKTLPPLAPTLGEENVLIPLVQAETTFPSALLCAPPRANSSSTEIKLSKISALSGKPYVTKHNPLNFFILVCEPPTAGDASQTGRQPMRRQRGVCRSGGTTS